MVRRDLASDDLAVSDCDRGSGPSARSTPLPAAPCSWRAVTRTRSPVSRASIGCSRTSSSHRPSLHPCRNRRVTAKRPRPGPIRTVGKSSISAREIDEAVRVPRARPRRLDARSPRSPATSPAQYPAPRAGSGGFDGRAFLWSRRTQLTRLGLLKHKDLHGQIEVWMNLTHVGDHPGSRSPSPRWSWRVLRIASRAPRRSRCTASTCPSAIRVRSATVSPP